MLQYLVIIGNVKYQFKTKYSRNQKICGLLPCFYRLLMPLLMTLAIIDENTTITANILISLKILVKV